MKKPVANDWYRSFFKGVALDFWSDCVPKEHTDQEVDFLIERLDVKSKAKLLDIPSGNGRHAIPLAKRGFKVTAVDLSDEFLERGRVIAKKKNLNIEFVHGDMADFCREKEFDGAFCLGNSFTYLSFNDLQGFLRNMAASLKSRARFIIDATMAAECILPAFQEREWYETGDIIMLLKNSYDIERGALETEYTFVRNGEIETRTSLHRVYTAAEIRRMLEAAGFRIVELTGSTDGEIFAIGSQQLYIVAEKKR